MAQSMVPRGEELRLHAGTFPGRFADGSTPFEQLQWAMRVVAGSRPIAAANAAQSDRTPALFRPKRILLTLSAKIHPFRDR